MTGIESSTVIAIFGAIGTLITSVIAAYTQSRKTLREVENKHASLFQQLLHAQADIDALQRDRKQLKEMLVGQTRALTKQSERLTETINALAAMTLDRDSLAQKVALLTEENAMLRKEIAVLKRRATE